MCVDMASKMVSWYTCYNLFKCFHRIFVAWLVFVKSIFSCLNLKPCNVFLPYNMPDVFNKTGHDLTDIVIAWYEFKPVLHSEYFWE